MNDLDELRLTACEIAANMLFKDVGELKQEIQQHRDTVRECKMLMDQLSLTLSSIESSLSRITGDYNEH